MSYFFIVLQVKYRYCNTVKIGQIFHAIFSFTLSTEENKTKQKQLCSLTAPMLIDTGFSIQLKNDSMSLPKTSWISIHHGLWRHRNNKRTEDVL